MRRFLDFIGEDSEGLLIKLKLSCSTTALPKRIKQIIARLSMQNNAFYADRPATCCKEVGAEPCQSRMHASSVWLAFGIWHTSGRRMVSSMLQRNQPHEPPAMIALLLTVAAAGVANIALVTFMTDRLGPKAGTVAAGEFAAVTGSAPASAKRNAVKVGNENVFAGAAERAA